MPTPTVITLGLADTQRREAQPPQRRGALGTATMSPKLQNEDAHACYHGEHFNLLLVADGVGSSRDAHEASQRAVTAMIDAAPDHDTRKVAPPRILRELWRTATSTLTAYRDEHDEYHGVAGALQTTLITLLETRDAYLLSYVGNGSAFVVRGDFWAFLERGRWPWPTTDVLLGHSVPATNGQEALYDTLHPGREGPVPGVWSIPKDHERGDVVILTTDGLSSRDHARRAQDATGHVYEECNPHIRRLLKEHLVHCLSAAPDEREHVLAKELSAFLDGAVVEDDATLGVIVSGATYEYFTAEVERP